MNTGEDDILDILMIGNSYCYFYVEELYQMAQAAGIKMRICNVYADGCTLAKHYTWWKTDQSNYSYFETFEAGRVKTGSVGLNWCLDQQKWDVISLQMGSSTVRSSTADQVLSNTKIYRAELYDYLRQRHPEARLLFHQFWAFEIGHTKSNGYAMRNLAQQKALTDTIRQVAVRVCEENQVDCVNTGDAWEIYREFCDQNSIAHNLCARLGKASGSNPHGGDGSHDGDIGGGQYLNACVWFELLTGQDCRENSYVPTYAYGGAEYGFIDGVTVQDLQTAAHQAVELLKSRV